MAVIVRKSKKCVRYQVRVRDSDKRWICETFDRKADAIAFESKIKVRKSSGGYVSGLGKQVPFSTYFEQWFETRKGGNVTPGWLGTQLQMFHSFVEPYCGKVPIAQIRPEHVAIVISKLKALGRSPQLQLHVYNLLHKMFQDAIELFRILDNSPVLRSLKPKVPHKEAGYLDPHTARNFLQSIEGHTYELAFWLNLVLGLRVGELQALRWEDIDLRNSTAVIRRTFARKENIFRDFPKGKRQRRIPIPGELLERLMEARERADSEFIVRTPGKRFLDYSHYRAQLKKVCRGLGLTKIGSHSLRHSSSELYMESGASRDDLRMLFGHSSSRITDTYVHDKGSRLEAVARNIRVLRGGKAS